MTELWNELTWQQVILGIAIILGICFCMWVCYRYDSK